MSTMFKWEKQGKKQAKPQRNRNMNKKQRFALPMLRSKYQKRAESSRGPGNHIVDK